MLDITWIERLSRAITKGDVPNLHKYPQAAMCYYFAVNDFTIEEGAIKPESIVFKRPKLAEAIMTSKSYISDPLAFNQYLHTGIALHILEKRKKDFSVYRLSKDITTALVHTKPLKDIRAFLPHTFVGIIQVPTTDYCFSDFFVHKHGDYLTCRDNPYNSSRKISHFRWRLSKVDELYEDGRCKKEVLSTLNLMLNLLLYIQYTDDKYLDLNKFHGSKNAIETKKKIYSSLKHYICGESFVLPNEYNGTYVDATVVKGHFRWQPFGLKRSKLKHIYIAPHTRVYDKDKFYKKEKER